MTRKRTPKPSKPTSLRQEVGRYIYAQTGESKLSWETMTTLRRADYTNLADRIIRMVRKHDNLDKVEGKPSISMDAIIRSFHPQRNQEL